MRRFLSLAVLIFFTVPFGASLAGCGHKTVTVFCNGGDSGPVVGQVKSITLSPNFATFGESLDYGQIGSGLSASAVDCKGTSVSLTKYTYATSDSSLTYADINPSTGQVCAGTFNQHSGGGIGDFTICNPPVISTATITSDSVVVDPSTTATKVVTLFGANSFQPGQQVIFSNLSKASFLNRQILTVTSSTPTSFTVNAAATAYAVTADAGTAVTYIPSVAYVTATGDGAVSNAIPVYIHPKVTSIVIGSPTPQANCATDPDPATNCCPQSTGAIVTAPAYTGGSCLSQGVSAQITARAYRNGTTNPADNITCQIGHLQYSAQNSSIFTVDQNGVATANQPGSTIVTASVSGAGTGGAAGFFATCPPASITLSIPGSAGASTVSVAVNTTQPLTAVVKDTNGVTLTGLSLEFTSTTPNTISAGAGLINPTFPGQASITAACQPSSCNAAPFSQIGLYGNGKPITSNPITVTAPGNNTSVIYIGSTQSQYILPVDFSTGQQGTLVKLPYIPNSMVISQDGSTIYLGSSTALMTVSAASNTVSSANQAVTGPVLSVSPDGSTVVTTDPVRQTVSLVAGGNVTSTYGGVGTHAAWSPDSQTVYITATDNTGANLLLVHSQYTGWDAIGTANRYVDLAVTVPSIGAFFATNAPITEARSYCASSTSIAAGNPPVVTNSYYPVANDTVVQNDRIAVTNDSLHLLGATATVNPAIFTDLKLTLPTTSACPTIVPTNYFGTSVNASLPLTGVTASSITGVLPASNSAVAFVTYTGASGLLPLYVPSTTGAGALSFVPLSGGATSAPVVGVFSTDNKTFFTGTSGDNQVHLISINGTAAAETSVITPKLPAFTGSAFVTPDLLVQRPKKSTN